MVYRPLGVDTMSETTQSEIEAAEGSKVRVVYTPSDVAKKVHDAEVEEYEATVKGVTTVGGHAGVSEMEKLVVEDDDDEEQRISLSAWGAEVEEDSTSVQIIESDQDDTDGDDDETDAQDADTDAESEDVDEATCSNCGHTGPKGDAPKGQKAVVWHQDSWMCGECKYKSGRSGRGASRRGGMGTGAMGR